MNPPSKLPHILIPHTHTRTHSAYAHGSEKLRVSLPNFVVFVCVCACVRVRVCLGMCVCVCVSQRILKADEAKQWIVWLTNFELDNQVCVKYRDMYKYRKMYI